MNKFGPYIQRLMTTILDKEQEEFVRNLALSELKRLNVNINEFIISNIDEEENSKQTIKQLLQEEKDAKSKQSS